MPMARRDFEACTYLGARHLSSRPHKHDEHPTAPAERFRNATGIPDKSPSSTISTSPPSPNPHSHTAPASAPPNLCKCTAVRANSARCRCRNVRAGSASCGCRALLANSPRCGCIVECLPGTAFAIRIAARGGLAVRKETREPIPPPLAMRRDEPVEVSMRYARPGRCRCEHEAEYATPQNLRTTQRAHPQDPRPRCDNKRCKHAVRCDEKPTKIQLKEVNCEGARAHNRQSHLEGGQTLRVCVLPPPTRRCDAYAAAALVCETPRQLLSQRG